MKYVEQIKQENLKLRDAAKRRTIELENKNRELEIEGSLERVRAVALSMKKPADMLEVCSVISDQLELLNLNDIRNLQTAIIDESKGIYLNYEYFTQYKRTSFLEIEIKLHSIVEEFVEKISKSSDAFFTKTIEGEALEDWREYRRKTNQDPDPLLNDAEAVHYYFYSIGPGALGISTYSPLNENDISIFKRFHNVFNLAYRRFIDIEQAEAQAREAQIELALERVRAKTMAMHRSEELSDTASVLFHELKRLGIESFRSGVCIIDYDTDSAELWLSTEIKGKTETKIIATVSGDLHPLYKAWFEAGRQKQAYYIKELVGKKVVEYYKAVSKHLHLPAQKVYNEKEVYHGFFFDEGTLNVVSLNRLSEDECNIILRFARVFGLLYRRFLDLKLAEEQAREAQIELALERVRSKAMAMHTSDDLAVTVDVFFHELKNLGVTPRRCGVTLIDEKSCIADLTVTAATDKKKDLKMTGKLKLAGHPILNGVYDHWKLQKEFHPVIKGDQIKKYYEVMNPQIEFPDFPDDEIQYGYYFYFKEGGVFAWTDAELSEEELKIFRKFRSVLSLTYRRYIDLKEAEAQAREAQIETALERVRARAMSMHKSDDLTLAVATVFSELSRLGFKTVRCGIGIFNNQNQKVDVWTTSANKKSGTAHLSGNEMLEGHPLLDGIFEAWKLQKDYSYVLKGQDLLDYYKTTSNSNLPVAAPEGDPNDITQYYHCIMFPSGGLFAFRKEEFSSEAKNLMRRFADVFQLTFTRHLDLRKAEAQAREAQIEAALEKIRNRTLLMKDSSELNDAVAVIFQQFKLLELLPDESRTYFSHVDTSTDSVEVWMTHADGRVMSESHITPMTKSPELKKYYNGWKKNKEIINTRVYKGQKLTDYMNFLTTLPHVAKDKDYRKLFKKPPVQIIMTDAGFLYGFLGIMSFEPLNPEVVEILSRFAKAIEFTYTRFLDLQKVEAQAREAQIEAALEKVRSRSLAMHTANELGEVVTVIVEKLKELGVVLDANGVVLCTYFQESKDVLHWIASPDFSFVGSYLLPYFDHPIFNDAWKSKENGDQYFSKAYSIEEKNSFFDYAFKHSDYKNFPDDFKQWIFQNDQHILSFAWQKHSAILIPSHTGVLPSEDDVVILKRFANVFEQAYVRFMDLQKAEAQAREAQIEACLERVRSRTMGMQNSEELKEVIQLIYEQFNHLDIFIEHTGFIVDHNTRDDMHIWLADENGAPSEIAIPYFDSPHWNSFIETKKKGENFFANHFSFKEKNKFYRKLFKHLPDLPEESKDFYFGCAGLAISTVVLENVSLYIENFSGTPYTDEENNILLRFGTVFQQTYTRFLDLKQAEEQAREAQIEASLERVRSKAMSMRGSEDLSETVNVFFNELKTLGIVPIRCGVGQVDEATRSTNLTTTTSSEQGKSFKVVGKVKQTGHPVLDGIFENWKLQKEYHPVLEGSEIKKYYSLMNAQIPYPDYPEDVTQYGNMFYFKEGFVFAWTEKELTDEHLQIFRRCTSVLSLTYRRYMDLKQAEARTKEAVRQASLDRVRAEIASMRTAKNLEKITPLIWHELTMLGVPFFRCGVFIFDEDGSKTHAYLSSPSGKSLAALHLEVGTGLWIDNAFTHWQEGKTYYEEWDQATFKAWTEKMLVQGMIEDREKFQAGHEAPEKLSLLLLPFVHGMLYIGSDSPLSEDEMETSQKLADALGMAYARYDDFQKLETAKKEVEKSLHELDLLSKELEIKNQALETENSRKALELEEARQLQYAMLPKTIPEIQTLDIAVHMQTATEVGGDYYDFHKDEDGTITIALGDATGHGLKAGTMVTITKSLFNSLAGEKDIQTTFNQMTRVIKEMKLRQLSMCLMLLKIKGNRLSMSSAAIPPALIYRANTGKVEEIAMEGMPLGTMVDFPYDQKSGQLYSGDTMFLLSDGLPELLNDSGEMYGYEKIKSELKIIGDKRPNEIIEHFRSSASDWTNGNDPDDDVTFVVVKMK